MSNAIEAWHHIVKTGDTDALNTLIADEAVFYSPVVHTPQKGKDITIAYLSGAYEVLINDTFEYLREIKSNNEAFLEFRAVIDGIEINGVDFIKWNDSNQIIEFRVWVRPLKAMNMLHAKMGEYLARQTTAAE